MSAAREGDLLHTHKTGPHMATVLQFVRTKSDFDDKANLLIGEVFDAACDHH